MASMSTSISLSQPSPLLLHRRLLASSFLPATPLSYPRKLPSIGLLASCSPSRFVAVASLQSNLIKVLQTAWRVGTDGVESGTNLVPDTVPRPVARISVAVVAATIALFVLKSIISTALFVLAMMGAIYFIFITFNNDEGPKGGRSSSSSSRLTTEEESLEEARRIMGKYK